MRVLVGVLAWVLIEIALFVAIGGAIGVWATLAWVVLSAVAGVLVMRLSAMRGAMGLRAGVAGLQSLREAGPAVGKGIFGMVAGVLLILPGFLTDALGLILLLPPVRAALFAGLAARATVLHTGTGKATGAGTGRGADRGNRPQGADVIDGDWQEVPPDPAPRIERTAGGARRSGWSQDDSGQ